MMTWTGGYRLVMGFVAGVVLSGCAGKITATSVPDFGARPAGVPWVEARLYDVYVYQNAGTIAGTLPSGQPGQVPVDPILLYYGQHMLTDSVNGKPIDVNRTKWVTNYEADTFSSAGLTLDFHENGSLKAAHLTSRSGVENALKAINTGLEIPKKMEEEALAELDREYKRLKLQNDIRSEREKLEKAGGK